MTAAERAGFRFPEDMSVAILGTPQDQESGGAAKLTGFALPRREMGAAAVRLLTSLIAGDQTVARHQLMTCELVTGGTAGPVR
jgi:DNA-binding LacI/PurR family transcriptional regulator